MKTRLVLLSAGILGIIAFGSCKKNYTCTCTTVIGSASSTQAHSVDKATLVDARNTCDNYERQANNTFPGGTTCHL